MSISSLDKTTEKIIENMAPDAKGRYVANLMHSLGQKVAAGKLSSEEAHTEYESFYSKYLRSPNPMTYIAFLEARENTFCTFLAVELLQKHGEVLDLKISYLQTLIDIQGFQSDPTPGELSELIEITREAENALQTLTKERDELHSHPAWKLANKKEYRDAFQTDDANKNETVNGAYNIL